MMNRFRNRSILVELQKTRGYHVFLFRADGCRRLSRKVELLVFFVFAVSGLGLADRNMTFYIGKRALLAIITGLNIR